MAERMTCEQVLERLRAAKAGFDALLARISPERLTAPELDGGWSVKDSLAHLSHWQADVIDRLSWPADRSRAPSDHADIEPINAEVYEQNRNRPLAAVRDEFERTYTAFAAAAAALSDDEFNDPHRWAWTNGRPIYGWFAGDGWEHYAEHADHIRARLLDGGTPA